MSNRFGPISKFILRACRNNDEVSFAEVFTSLGLMEEISAAHRRFHEEAGCVGSPECPVCAEEEFSNDNVGIVAPIELVRLEWLKAEGK